MENKEIKMDEKIKVISIAPWHTGCKRLLSIGDVTIPPSGSVMLTRDEVITQAQTGNRLLNGMDNKGSHATWYIQDEWTRQELGFDDGTPQMFISKNSVKKIFDLKLQKTFEEAIREQIITRAEKGFLMSAIKDLKINDYHKIVFCQNHTGIKMPKED